MSRRRQLTRLVAVLLFATLVPCVVLGSAEDLEKLSFPKLRDIKMPQVTEVSLKNGMTLMLVEDHELPVIQMRALVRAGKVYEPKDLNGLAELMGSAWRTGGTTSKTGDEIDELLESIGAKIEGSVEESSAELYANTLKENFDRVLGLFVDFLVGPAFREDKIDLARTQMRSSISRRNDEPMSILMREYQKLVYGTESPYARQVEYDDVDKLQRQHLLDFHRKYFHPNAVILGVWGDFKTSDMKKKIQTAFAAWSTTNITYPELPVVDVTPEPSVNYAEKKDIEQCFVLMGHIGMRLDDPDYPAFYVMSDILGGGWTSRLFKKVRSELGLAYAVGGGLLAGYDHPGPVYIFASTKFASTHQAISAMREEVSKITQSEVADNELSLAKESYLNSFAFQFDSVGKILNRLMTYKYYGYPTDFLQKTRAAIEKVSKEDVLRVAKKRLLPEKLTLLAVGDASQFDKPLSSFGTVRVVDITIPQPSEDIPEPGEASEQSGIEVMNAALNAMGGKEKVMSVGSVKSVFDVSVSTPGGELSIQMDMTFVHPDRVHIDMQTPMGPVTQVLNRNKGWMRTSQGVIDLQGSQIEELLNQVQFDVLSLFRAFAEGSANPQLLGENDFEGRKVFDVLLTTASGGTVHLYIDTDNYSVAGNLRRASTMEGPQEVTEVFSDIRDVQGLKVSFASVQRAGQKQISATVHKQLKLNPKVDPAIFERPEK
ncbi:MAG: pitrilysin family protein [Candidatus Eisenbacteria bacterium]